MPRKAIKAFPGRGQHSLSWALSSPLTLSHLESGQAVPFSHGISVVHVYLPIAATTQDPVGQDSHHPKIKQMFSTETIWGTQEN